MKRALILLLVVMFMAASSVFAAKSEEKTADASIVTGAGCFVGIAIQTDGTNSVTIAVYDNTAASGTDLIAEWVVTSSSTDRYHVLGFDTKPCVVPYYTGIYVDITTSGTCKYMVYYLPGAHNQ